MYYFLIVFSSRSESVGFDRLLKIKGISSALVTTPRECMTGCGLSVKVYPNSIEKAEFILRNYDRKSTLRGIFRVEKQGINSVIKRVK